MLLALKDVHDEDICHLDVKFENFIITCSNPIKVKIIDFGFSKKEGLTINKNIGTIGYIAPEIINKKEYSKKSDIWSIGTCLLYYFTNEKAIEYNQIDNVSIINKFDQAENIKKILKMTLMEDSNKRSNIDEIIDEIKNLITK